MAGWVLGVDFGTSFTTAAVADGDRVYVVEIDSSRYLPSVVGLDEDGLLLTGRAAASLAAVLPDRAERLPKRQVGQTERLLLGEREVPVVELVAAVLRRVSAEAVRRQDGVAPARLVLTHPVRWGQAELAVLTAAAKAAGLPAPEFVAEPVAAALWYARDGGPVPDGAAVAVYDLGGGTFDVAVLRRRGDSYETLADGGDPRLGGEDLDEALADLVAAHAAALDPAGWRTAQDNPANADLLRQAVVQAKHQLSEQTTHRVMLPGLLRSPRVTRSEFVDAIDPLLRTATAILRDTITTAGLTPADLAAVYLTGGSSRIPHVTDTVTDTLGLPRPPRTTDDPKAVVAQGATQWKPTEPRVRPQMAFHVSNLVFEGLEIRRLAFTRDSTHLLADVRGNTSRQSCAMIVDHASGEVTAAVPYNSSSGAADFSRDGGRIALAGEEKVAYVIDAATRVADRYGPDYGHDQPIRGMKFSPDGSRLATLQADGSVVVISLDADVPAKKFPDSSLQACAFSNSGNKLASVSAQRLWVYYLFPDQPAATIAFMDLPGQLNAMTFSFDGSRLALCYDDVHLIVLEWPATAINSEPSTIKTFSSGSGRVSSLTLSRDGRRLAFTVEGGGTSIVDLDTDQAGGGSRISSGIAVQTTSADGTYLVTVGHDGDRDVHNLATGQWVMGGEDVWPGPVCAAALSPDSRLVAFGYQNGVVFLFDLLDAGPPIAAFESAPEGTAINTLAFSHDGTLLASGNANSTIAIWRLDVSPEQIGRSTAPAA